MKYLAMVAVSAVLVACAAPGPESGITPEQWRERVTNTRITAAQLLITDLRLRKVITPEEERTYRTKLNMVRTCLLGAPDCALNDTIELVELAKRAAQGDALARLDVAEKALELLDKRLQEKAASAP